MTLDIDYCAITPKDKDVCVVYCYYNPGGDPVVLKNALELESKLKNANIPYFNAEILLGNASPSLTNASLTLKTQSNLFYKESAWNLIENIIPIEFTKICFMEVNVRYNNPKWLEVISHMLNFYPVVKPYTTVYTVDTEGNTHCVENTVGDGSIIGIKRDMFKKINGFFEKGVVLHDTLNKAINNPDTPIGIPMLESDYAIYTSGINSASCKLRPVSTILYLLYNGVVTNTNFLDSLKSASSWDSLFSLNESHLWELREDMLDNTFKSIYPVAEPTPEPTPEPVVEPVVVPVPVVEPVPEPVYVPVVAPTPVVMAAPVAPRANPFAPRPTPVAIPVRPTMKPVARVVQPTSSRINTTPITIPSRIAKKAAMPVAMLNEQARAEAAALIAKFIK